ncbi:MAG TPA: hypothetical protein VFE03_13075 [Caulobacteraceae bacterium]|jgi:hypothetical protein|nr:hypothetical protein [Caulobacteraceae bacterium]
MHGIVDRESLKQRELVVRVATLELLVSDLLHVLRQVAPQVVEDLAAEAVIDRDGQMCRDMPDGAEHQRFRLHQVLDERARRLKHKRFSARLQRQRCEATD